MHALSNARFLQWLKLQKVFWDPRELPATASSIYTENGRYAHVFLCKICQIWMLDASPILAYRKVYKQGICVKVTFSGLARKFLWID